MTSYSSPILRIPLLLALLNLSLLESCQSTTFLTMDASIERQPMARISKSPRHAPIMAAMSAATHTICMTNPSISFVLDCPRGGGASIGNRKSQGGDYHAVVQTSASDTGEQYTRDETDDEEEVKGPELYPGEIMEIRKEQSFLEKQRLRRELDKTWLDKCITAFIEVFENIFRWEVTD
eukprot:CAMPEP_0171328482 /NCGR_PEP_ID=MMETSP0878-20121228/680_1 /TAXON_ID=67004 /ORGANISM="Thalassiosira weissflogii, Strain CCMP1336" /LENGTH=178 /DNA_ID=CAMNT_0011828335 /DNA_START=40 /DNA_END=576 /DNA_ORIENTATION=+